MADDPVAYWRLNEAMASEPAQDIANDYDGVYQGGITFGKSALVDGERTERYASTAAKGRGSRCRTISDFASKAPFTIEAWIKLETVKTAYIVHKMSNDSSLNGYELPRQRVRHHLRQVEQRFHQPRRSSASRPVVTPPPDAVAPGRAR